MACTSPGFNAGLTCSQLRLGCATAYEIRAYEVQDGGRNLLSSRCFSPSDVGSPQNLCQLAQLKNVQILSGLALHQSIQLEITGFQDVMGQVVSCDSSLVGFPVSTLFDGTSAPLSLDGADHTLTVPIDSCDGCPSCQFNVSDGGPPLFDGGLPFPPDGGFGGFDGGLPLVDGGGVCGP
jgi:hypothetical protein